MRMRLPSAAFLAAMIASSPAVAFERTEVREACASSDPLRQPFFGDLHVHTRLSWDAFTNNPPAGPREAYQFARGEEVDVLPCVSKRPHEGCAKAQIRRRLDFTAVTDHAEGFGSTGVCDDPANPGYESPDCKIFRGDFGPQTGMFSYLFAGIWFYGDPLPMNQLDWPVCQRPDVDCDTSEVNVWGTIRAAAEEHYDRSANCDFTTFVAYEWTGTPLGANLHRNVIFRNKSVPLRPISKVDTGPDPAELWRRLKTECSEAGIGCDVLAIPHNPNLSSGQQFLDPENAGVATLQSEVEPLVEIMQLKGASECRIGYGTNDELCGFELLPTGTFFPFPRPEPVFGDQFDDRSFVRNILKEGIRLGRTEDLGVNPWEMGFVGATDTHLGTPAAVDEQFPETGTSLGAVSENPGGLTVVWAAENSRDSIFTALRNRETYATSGTRPIVRFFGGTNLPEDPFASGAFVADGYANGVPMGARLNDAPAGTGKPRFAVLATKDPMGVDLDAVQIIKGWVDANGMPQERPVTVAGELDDVTDLKVDDADDCTDLSERTGDAELRAVWTDEEFDKTKPAFWYVRVLEKPTCRWQTHECVRNGVYPDSDQCAEQAAAKGGNFDQCCSHSVERVIRERAWTSPIFWRAG